MTTMADVDAGLREWVSQMTGIPLTAVVWEDEPRPYMPNTYAVLRRFAMSVKGTDGMRLVFDEQRPQGQELRVTTFGNRQFTLTVEVRSLSQGRADRADHYIELLRNMVHMPQSQTLFLSLNIGFVRSENPVDVSALVDDRRESRCALDLRFNTAIRQSQPGDEGLAYFERAQIEDGESDDLEIPGTYGVPDP